MYSYITYFSIFYKGGANSDGCSIPFDWTYFHESRFTPSCVAHDVCYACVSTVSLFVG